MVRRFEPNTPLQTNVVSDAGARASQGIQQRLGVVTNRAITQHTVNRRAAGLREGERAGLQDGGPDLQDENTVFGRAFNQAAITSYQAATANDIREQLATIEGDFEADPDGFDGAFQSMREGFLEGVPEQLRPRMELELDTRATSTRMRVNQRFLQRAKEQQQADYLTGINGIEADIERAARDGDVELSNKFIEDYQSLLDQGVANGQLSAEQSAARSNAAEDGLVANFQIGNLERALTEGGLAAGQQVLRQFRKNGKKSLRPSLGDRLDATMESMVSRVEREQERRRRQLEAEQAAQVRAVRADWKDAEFLLGEGREPENVNELVTRAIATGDEALINEVVGDVRQFEVVAQFSQLSPAAQTEALRLAQDQTRTSATADELRLVRRMEKTKQAQDRLLESDPLTLAQNKKIIGELPALGEPGALQERKAAAARATEALGVPVPALTGPEIDSIAQSYAQANAPERLQLLGSLTQELGGEAERVFAGMDARNYGSMAMVGSLMLDNPAAADAVLRGQDVLVERKDILPPKAELNEKLNEVLGTAYASNPRVDAQVRQAVTAAYAQYALANGNIDGDAVDTGDLRQAAQMVTGGIVEYGDSLLPAPDYGVTPRQFDDYIDALDESAIEAMGGLSVPAEGMLRELKRQNVTLLPIGRGQYRVIGESPRGGQVMYYGKDGNPFTLLWDPDLLSNEPLDTEGLERVTGALGVL